MLTLVFLAITAAAERRDCPSPDDLIPLAANEIQHLFTAPTSPVYDLTHRLHRSQWRRRHHARDRASHHRWLAAMKITIYS